MVMKAGVLYRASDLRRAAGLRQQRLIQSGPVSN
jgi:hypothetical protein